MALGVFNRMRFATFRNFCAAVLASAMSSRSAGCLAKLHIYFLL